MTSNTGMSPNPFAEYLTLACCKPQIRKLAKIGDWVVGIRGKILFDKTQKGVFPGQKEIFKIIYAFEVIEKLTFEGYWNDKRFENKKPNMKSELDKDRCGDNFYEPTSHNSYIQKDSMHSNFNKNTKEYSENDKHKKNDTHSNNVLISGVNNFWFFGSNPLCIPYDLKSFANDYKSFRQHKVFSKNSDKLVSYITRHPSQLNHENNYSSNLCKYKIC